MIISNGYIRAARLCVRVEKRLQTKQDVIDRSQVDVIRVVVLTFACHFGRKLVVDHARRAAQREDDVAGVHCLVQVKPGIEVGLGVGQARRHVECSHVDMLDVLGLIQHS